MPPDNIERRMFPAVELRVEGDDENPKIVGHAAVFNQLSEDLGGFREKIDPGAFSKTLGGDVRALFNHDPNIVLGRTKAKTLRLAEDGQGLAVEIDPPKSEVASALMESIARGDVSQMSFGFFTREDEFNTDDDGQVIRTLKEVELFDVSPVTFPAYPQTDVAARAYRDWLGGGEKRGRRLGALLNRLIDDLATEDRPRDDIVEAMGRAAGIDAGTVNQILSGSIDCPPLPRLRGFARVLQTTLARLQTAAEADGCEYDGGSNKLEIMRARQRQASV